MNRIVEFKLAGGYKIWLRFNDNSTKTIDFRPFLKEGLSKELLDADYFKKVEIESGGGLAWPNEYDFCPNFLHDYVEDSIQEPQFAPVKA